MKKHNLYASIICSGVHGGAIKMLDDSFMFRAQKITIPQEVKNLKIMYNKIASIHYKRKFILFPVIEIELKNQKRYKFIVFNHKYFLSHMPQEAINR